MSGFQLAQVNIALPREPLESELLQEFVEALDPINALADSSRGFVWRLQGDDGNATSIRAFGDDRLIVNMSVWESIDALRAFVYTSGHVGVMRRRREWFERIETHFALWWVPAGHIPTLAEAEERVTLLRAVGPSPDAFTFRRHFPPPGLADSAGVDDDRWLCPA
jgi:uncharacterized protein DUF3291